MLNTPSAVLAACLAGLAAASPMPRIETSYIKSEPKASFIDARQEAPAAEAPDARPMIAWPEPHVDKNDLANLKATHDAVLYYAESADDVDQQVVTLDSQDPQFPMVQLEFSNFVQSVSCTDRSASVTFSTQEAFDAAAADWTSQEQFVIISTDPACGPDHDETKRDYMLASAATPDPQTLTINTGVEFIEWKAAFGETAMIHGTIGRYTSATGQKKRQIDGSTDFNWDIAPTTPLGAGFAGETGFGLFSDVNMEIACIDCNTKGDVTVTGTFDFSLFSGVEEASVTVEGSMSANINLGINARLTQTIPIANTPLATIPLSPLTIAGIVTVGPRITIEAGANIDLTAQGTLIMGAALDWPAIRVKGDFASGNTESSGLDPNVTPRADLRSSISAVLRLDSPVSIGVGINIANGVFDRALALTATPGFRVSATIDTDPACEGVAVNAGLGMPIVLDVFEVTTVPLVTTFTTALFTTCFLVDIPLPTFSLPAPEDPSAAPEQPPVDTGAPAPPEITPPPPPPGSEAPPPEGEAPPPEGEAPPPPEGEMPPPMR